MCYHEKGKKSEPLLIVRLSPVELLTMVDETYGERVEIVALSDLRSVD